MVSDREQLIQSIRAAKELLIRKARNNFKTFVPFAKPDYEMQWFHAYICDKLDEFEQGKIKKLMILLPPQTGKSTLATRLFTSYALGKNPDRKIAITSYSDGIASGFNRDIQRIIDSEDYGLLFPDTKLNNSRIFNTNYPNHIRTEHKFDIVNHSGSVKTVGRGGSLTSESVDIGIIDDLYKDRDEAMSMTISESAWNWYVDVFRTRFHNDSQQLIMNTRWDENDIAGRLLVEEPGEWVVIKFPAIRTKDVNDYDIRKEGEALWEDWHSLEKILGQKKLSEVSFNSLQQQDPKPNTEILIYKDWIEIPEWPKDLDSISYGMDFGKETGINSLVKTAISGDSAYFHELLYEPGIPAQYVKEILLADGYDGQLVHADHMPTKINALRLLGVECVPAIKGPGSVIFGIDKLHEYKCHYTRSSVNLKMELNKYQYICYGKVITREPLKKHDHCFTGDTLVETITGKKRIDKILVGDFLLTSNGYKEVFNTWDNGEKEVYEYLIRTRTKLLKLTCTKDHLIKTSKGWVEISKLQSGMTVYLRKKEQAEPYEVTNIQCSKLEIKRVYDLTVNETHEYFANGILVHNCMDAIRYGSVGRFFRGGG